MHVWQKARRQLAGATCKRRPQGPRQGHERKKPRPARCWLSINHRRSESEDRPEDVRSEVSGPKRMARRGRPWRNLVQMCKQKGQTSGLGAEGLALGVQELALIPVLRVLGGCRRATLFAGTCVGFWQECGVISSEVRRMNPNCEICGGIGWLREVHGGPWQPAPPGDYCCETGPGVPCRCNPEERMPPGTAEHCSLSRPASKAN